MTNLSNVLPHLQIKRFTNSLIDGEASLVEQRPNSLIHIFTGEPDLEQFDAINL